MLDDLFQTGGDGDHGLARTGPAVEGDDLDLRVEQQLEGEALLLAARPKPHASGAVWDNSSSSPATVG